MAQTQFCDNGVVPAAFYSHSLRWTLLRAALLALLAFVFLDVLLDAWLAAVLAMLAGGLHVVDAMAPAAFYSYSLRWTLLRAALLALLAFVGLDLWLDAWLAAVLAMLAGGLHVVDATRARRADARSSSAETIVSR